MTRLDTYDGEESRKYSGRFCVRLGCLEEGESSGLTHLHRSDRLPACRSTRAEARAPSRRKAGAEATSGARRASRARVTGMSWPSQTPLADGASLPLPFLQNVALPPVDKLNLGQLRR